MNLGFKYIPQFFYFHQSEFFVVNVYMGNSALDLCECEDDDQFQDTMGTKENPYSIIVIRKKKKKKINFFSLGFR